MPPSIKEIQNAYHDNADYLATRSVAKCRLFITACIRIISLPSRAAEKGQGTSAEHEFDTERIYQQQKDAEKWLSQNETVAEVDGGGSIEVIDVDFRPGSCRR